MIIYNIYYHMSNKFYYQSYKINDTPTVADKTNPTFLQITQTIKNDRKTIIDYLPQYDIVSYIKLFDDDFKVINSENYVLFKTSETANNIYKVNIDGSIITYNAHTINNIANTQIKYLTLNTITPIINEYTGALILLLNNKILLKKFQINAISDYYVKCLQSKFDYFYFPNLHYLMHTLFNYDYANDNIFINKRNNIVNFMISYAKFDLLISILKTHAPIDYKEFTGILMPTSSKIISKKLSVIQSVNINNKNKAIDYSDYKTQIDVDNITRAQNANISSNIPDTNFYKYIIANIITINDFNAILKLKPHNSNINYTNLINYVYQIYLNLMKYFDANPNLKTQLTTNYNSYLMYSNRELINVGRDALKPLGFSINQVYHKLLIELTLIKFCYTQITINIPNFDVGISIIMAYFFMRMQNTDYFLPLNYHQQYKSLFAKANTQLEYYTTNTQSAVDNKNTIELKQLYDGVYENYILQYKYFNPSVLFNIDGDRVSDCGETTLMNFFLQTLSDINSNIVVDNNNNSVYLKNFNTIYSGQLNDFFKKYNIFDKLDTINAHNDFSKIIQNLPLTNVNGMDIRSKIYNHKHQNNDTIIYYEIKPSLQNINIILQYILKGERSYYDEHESINEINEINKLKSIISDINNTSKSITTSSSTQGDVILQIESQTYNYNFNYRHSECSVKNTTKNIFQMSQVLQYFKNNKLIIDVVHNANTITYNNVHYHFDISIHNIISTKLEIMYLFSFKNQLLKSNLSINDMQLFFKLVDLQTIINYIKNNIYAYHTLPKIINNQYNFYLLTLCDPFTYIAFTEYNRHIANRDLIEQNAHMLYLIFEYFLHNSDNNLILNVLNYYLNANKTLNESQYNSLNMARNNTVLIILKYLFNHDRVNYDNNKYRVSDVDNYYIINTKWLKYLAFEFLFDLFGINNILMQINSEINRDKKNSKYTFTEYTYLRYNSDSNNEDFDNTNSNYLKAQVFIELDKLFYDNRDLYYDVLSNISAYNMLNKYNPSMEINGEIIDKLYDNDLNQLINYVKYDIVQLNTNILNALMANEPDIVANAFIDNPPLLSKYLAKYDNQQLFDTVSFFYNKIPQTTIDASIIYYETHNNRKSLDNVSQIFNGTDMNYFLMNANTTLQYIIENNDLIHIIDNNLTNNILLEIFNGDANTIQLFCANTKKFAQVINYLLHEQPDSTKLLATNILKYYNVFFENNLIARYLQTINFDIHDWAINYTEHVVENANLTYFVSLFVVKSYTKFIYEIDAMYSNSVENFNKFFEIATNLNLDDTIIFFKYYMSNNKLSAGQLQNLISKNKKQIQELIRVGLTVPGLRSDIFDICDVIMQYRIHLFYTNITKSTIIIDHVNLLTMNILYYILATDTVMDYVNGGYVYSTKLIDIYRNLYANNIKLTPNVQKYI